MVEEWEIPTVDLALVVEEVVSLCHSQIPPEYHNQISLGFYSSICEGGYDGGFGGGVGGFGNQGSGFGGQGFGQMGGGASARGGYGNDFGDMGRAAGGGGPGGCVVLLISNIPEELANVTNIFNMVGMYGDVVAVKILRNKTDCCLVQLAKPHHAQQVIAVQTI